MRRLLLVLLLTTSAFAADHVIRASCPNNGDGTRWQCDGSPGGTGAGAYNTMPTGASAIRGDTYWFAGGVTPAFTITVANSGSTVLTLKAATQANHGIATDWDNAFAVDNGAGLVTNPVKLHSTACATAALGPQVGYLNIDGQVGGAGVTNGFYAYTDCDLASFMQAIVRLGAGTGLANGATVIMNNITFNNFEIDGQMSEAWYVGNPSVSTGHRCLLALNDTTSNVTMTNFYFHNCNSDVVAFIGCDSVNVGSCPQSNTSQSHTNLTLDHGYLGFNRSAANHAQGIYLAFGVNTATISNTVFNSIEGTAEIVCLTGKCSDLRIYGNSFTFNAAYNASPHGGVSKIFGDNWAADTAHNYNAINGSKFYNNSIFNIGRGIAGDRTAILNGSVAWIANHAYTLGLAITDGTNIQKVTTAGTSQTPGPPTWNSSLSGTTSDGTVTWTNIGPQSTVPDTRNNLWYGNADPVTISGSTHDYNLYLNTATNSFVKATHETVTASGSSCPFSDCTVGVTDARLIVDTATYGVAPDQTTNPNFDSTSPFNAAPYNVDPNGLTRKNDRGAFELSSTPFTLTATCGGTGSGTVCSDGAACVDGIINCTCTAGVATVTCSHNFAGASNVTLTETTTSGVFNVWTNPLACLNSGAATCGITNIQSALTATASFNGSATGSLSISPANLNIGQTATFTWSCQNSNLATLTNVGLLCSDSATCTAGGTTAAVSILPYTTYTLSCTGASGTGTANVNPTVSAFYLGVGTANGIK